MPSTGFNDIVKQNFIQFFENISSRKQVIKFLGADNENNLFDYSYKRAFKRVSEFESHKFNLAIIADKINTVHFLREEINSYNTSDKSNKDFYDHNKRQIENLESDLKLNLMKHIKEIEDAYFSCYECAKNNKQECKKLQEYAQWLAIELDCLIGNPNPNQCLIPSIDPREHANAAVCTTTIFPTGINHITNQYNTDKTGINSEERAHHLKSRLIDKLKAFEKKHLTNSSNDQRVKKSIYKLIAILENNEELQSNKKIILSNSDVKRIRSGKLLKIISGYADLSAEIDNHLKVEQKLSSCLFKDSNFNKKHESNQKNCSIM
ncbi:hypothetical protein [Piscirickettsia salmonis]|uniref:hypothetical protein n=1 Tax=Piscirickettsia salmonis TaxID=1238 RepID=UPI0007C8FA7B|nr:hypothetical protein A0O36_02587 [Piscirickettsiaceae bacterium NZ-RLO1]